MPRQGYITPSTFADLMSNGRGTDTFGKTALKVIDLLTLDLLGVERPEQGGTPTSCQWGIDHEWEAIQEYENRTFRSVQSPVEFRTSPTHEYVGGSMDGLVGSCGGIEVKSPYNSMEHLYNLQSAKQLHELYMYQVQGYFWIYGLEWIDFISYDPRFPKPENLFIERVYPDKEKIKALQERCEKAYALALENVKQIQKRQEFKHA